MKRILALLLALVMVFSLVACGVEENSSTTSDQSTDSEKSSSKNNEYLYNWLLENGELINNTELMYKDDTFILSSDHSKKMYIDYTIPDYNGCQVTVQLPLYDKSKKVSTEITVNKEDYSVSLTYYHKTEDFSNKSPIEYGSISSYPPLDIIVLDDFGELKYENGKYVFHLDESKREEYEKLKNKNSEIKAQHKILEDIAKEMSHKTLCDILNWLDEKLCPLAEMNLSDFGYKAYK